MVKVKVERKKESKEKDVMNPVEPNEECAQTGKEGFKEEVEVRPEGEGKETEYEELKRRLEEAENLCKCLRADFVNYKRNVELERAQIYEQSKDIILKDIFTILEHLERAIEAGEEHNIDRSVLEGLLLMKKEILNILAKHKVERISTVGEKFNPGFHEAISTVYAPDKEPGIVLYEQKPGFIREGKVIQHAKVVVSKAEKE